MTASVHKWDLLGTLSDAPLAGRLKCWECGVKKKAPCGQTQRSDLPWCCHRRLGEWVNLLTIGHDENGNIVFHGEHHWLLA